MVIHYKMYLAAPVPGKPDRFPFVFSRADDHHTLYAMFGEHGEELLEGVEDGMVGMKARASVVACRAVDGKPSCHALTHFAPCIAAHARRHMGSARSWSHLPSDMVWRGTRTPRA